MSSLRKICSWLGLSASAALILSTANILAAPEVVGWGLNDYGQITIPGDLTNVTAISAAGGVADFDGAYGLALKGDGTIVAWGNPQFGQTSVPADLTNVVAISAGTYHALALRADGRVAGWGRGEHGATNVPTDLSNVVAITAGAFHSLALRSDGTVAAWGAGAPGQLGWPSAGQSTIPTGLSNVIAVAAGWQHSLALQADGKVSGWGTISVPADATNMVAIASGDSHCLALRADGTIKAWGFNLDFAATVPNGLSNVVAIAAGGRLSLAIRDDGSVVGWGFWNTTHVPPALNPAVALDAGYLFCIGLRANSDAALPQIIGIPHLIATAGRPFRYRVVAKNGATNFNAAGLPAGLTIDRETGQISGTAQQPGTFPVMLGATNASGGVERLVTLHVNPPVAAIRSDGLVQALPGEPFVFAVKADNAPTWFSASGLPPGLSIHEETGVISGIAPFSVGDFPVSLQASNSFGVGVGALTIRMSAVIGWGADGNGQVTGAGPLSNIVAIAAGANHSLALREDGTLVPFGTNVVPGGIGKVVQIAAGASHNLALRENGTVVAWGANQEGQTNVPAGLSNVIAIAAGSYHSLALTSTGLVVGWGAEGRVDRGQAAVPSWVSNVIGIAGGREHSLALTSDGRVLAWGSNGQGQTNVPPGLSNVIAIAAGESHNLALRNDGAVVAWGSASVYPATNGLSNVIAIAAFGTQSIAIQSDRSVVAWGPPNYVIPTPPEFLRNAVGIAAGGSHALAIVPTAPGLKLRRMEAGSLLMKWSAAAAQWRLQESGLPNTAWADLELPRFDDGTNVSVMITPSAERRFFKLAPP